MPIDIPGVNFQEVHLITAIARCLMSALQTSGGSLRDTSLPDPGKYPPRLEYKFCKNRIYTEHCINIIYTLYCTSNKYTEKCKFMPSQDYATRPKRVRSVEEFGHALRTARKSKGMTQGDLARIAGIQAHHVSTIETGTTKPTAATIFILLAALDLDCILVPRGEGGDGKSRNIEDIF